MKFAFWNVHQNPVINHYIVDLIYENELDIIVLAEYKDNEQKLIDELTQKGIYMEKYLTSGCDRIMMFGSIQKVMPANQNKYYSIQIIDKKCILCGMHLPSRIYSDHQERRNIVIDRIVEDINELEMKLKIENTIILGDVNENPYDVGCLNASKFHGISSGVKHLKCFIIPCGTFLETSDIHQGHTIIMGASLAILFGIFMIK